MGLFNMFKKMTVAEGFAIIMDDNASAQWAQAGAAFSKMKEDGRLQNIAAVAAQLRGVPASFMQGENSDCHNKTIDMLWISSWGEVSIKSRQMVGVICKRWPDFAQETKALALEWVNGKNAQEAYYYLAADAFHGWTEAPAPDKAKEYLDACIENGGALTSEPLFNEIMAKLQ